MLEAGADTIVLGCTHYPFLKPSIQQSVGIDITLIDTGLAVAKRTISLLPNNTIQQSNRNPEIKIQTTGNLDLLESIFPALCPNLQHNTQLNQLSLS